MTTKTLTADQAETVKRLTEQHAGDNRRQILRIGTTRKIKVVRSKRGALTVYLWLDGEWEPMELYEDVKALAGAYGLED